MSRSLRRRGGGGTACLLLALLVHGAPAQAEGNGGAEYGVRPARLTAPAFSAPRVITPGGPAVTFRFRLAGRSVRRARVEIWLAPPGAAAPSVRLTAGVRRVGVAHRHRWQPPAGVLMPGAMEASLHVRDASGRDLRRTARASGRSALEVRVAQPLVIGTGLFPIRGPYSLGGPDARFGAGRGDRLHHGQDVMCAAGTPLIAPVGGTIFWRDVQDGGAGWYLVLRGDDGTDYVFMHLREESVLVARDDRVAAGQQLAQTGSSGRSTAPHLHLEIWPHGWFAKGSEPVDPLPYLQQWAAAGG